MKFEVDAVDEFGRIVGRNICEDIPIGFIFTRITKSQFEGQNPHIISTDLGVFASIRLTLKRVEWYGKSIDVIPGGHTAGLLVDGDGMDILNSALENRKRREYIYIVVQ